MEPECKVDFLTWYQANKITADRIINDLKKQSFEAVMHLLCLYCQIIETGTYCESEGLPHSVFQQLHESW